VTLLRPLLVATVLVVAAMLPTAPTVSRAAAPTVTAREAFDRANAANARKDWEAALKWLRVANSLQPQAGFVANQATALKNLGRYSEALRTFLRALGMPHLTAELEGLIRQDIELVKPLAERAWLAVPKGKEAVQVDGRMRMGRAGMVALEPGKRLICVDSGGLRITCHWRMLVKGRRLPWAPGDAWATVRIVRGKAKLKRLKVNSVEVLVDSKRVVDLVVPPGEYELDGGDTQQRRLRLGVGESVDWVLVPPTLSGPAEVAPDDYSWGWGFVAVGSLGLIASAALLGLGEGERSDIVDRVRAEGPERYPEGQARDDWSDANAKTTAGWVALGVGAALVAVGITLVSLSDGSEDSKATTSVVLGPGSATVMGRF